MARLPYNLREFGVPIRQPFTRREGFGGLGTAVLAPVRRAVIVPGKGFVIETRLGSSAATYLPITAANIGTGRIPVPHLSRADQYGTRSVFLLVSKGVVQWADQVSVGRSLPTTTYTNYVPGRTQPPPRLIAKPQPQPLQQQPIPFVPPQYQPQYQPQPQQPTYYSKPQAQQQPVEEEAEAPPPTPQALPAAQQVVPMVPVQEASISIPMMLAAGASAIAFYLVIRSIRRP